MASINTYKGLVDQIISIKSQDDFDRVCASISNAFQHGEKISFKDYEQLYKLAERISF